MIVGSRTAPAADGNGVCRRSHLISLVTSTILHGSIVAAVIYGAFGTTASPPDPIIVELVADVGTGPTGVSARGGQEGTAPGAGETRPAIAGRSSVGAQQPVETSPTRTSGEFGPSPSRRSAVARKTHSNAKKLRHAPRQPTVAELAEAAPATASAPFTEANMPAEDALSPSDDRMPSDGRVVASLGAGGAARTTGGAGARADDPGVGDHGSTHGPGFSLGSGANPMPSYPPAARRRGIEGKVVLDVLVSAEGQALAVEIARSSGSSLLDEAARETIRRWRFRPATRGDKAIEARATVPVQFSLIEP